MVRTIRVALLALSLAACTHASRGSSGGSDNLITEEQIDASGGVTVMDVIQKVRRNFLTDRGKTGFAPGSPTKPSVFLDGIQYGEIESLRTISARQASTIRLYRAWEAQQKFGNGFVGGVIEVTTRK
jgi:hypothetical protein